MEENFFKELLHSTNALRAGHYVRSSGRHSDYYVQCAHLLQEPGAARGACNAIARRFESCGVQLVFSAAVGGVIVGYETARQLGARMIYAERRDNVLTLRREFTMAPGTRVLIVEDTVSTGRSVRELMEIVRAMGGETVGVACLIDTAGMKLDFGCPYLPLYTQKVATYPAESCPLCQQGVPLDNV